MIKLRILGEQLPETAFDVQGVSSGTSTISRTEHESWFALCCEIRYVGRYFFSVRPITIVESIGGRQQCAQFCLAVHCSDTREWYLLVADL